MKKILVADSLKFLIEREKSILHRAEVKVLTAATNDDILAIHRAEKVNLIITQLDMAGINCEQLFSVIRNDKDLRQVSVIMLYADKPADRERAQRCHPNAVLPLPVHSTLLLEKVQHLLNVSWRESYRVLLSVSVEGKGMDNTFFCRSENISATGLLLETERSLNAGDRLTCSFFLPGAKQIKVDGEVVRQMRQSDKSEAKWYGVKFKKPGPECKAAIEAFVTRKALKSR